MKVIFAEWGGVVAMAFKVRSRGNIVLADRRSGLDLDCDSVNYLVCVLLAGCREVARRGAGKALRHVCSLLTDTCEI